MKSKLRDIGCVKQDQERSRVYETGLCERQKSRGRVLVLKISVGKMEIDRERL